MKPKTPKTWNKNALNILCIVFMLAFIVFAWTSIYIMMDKISVIHKDNGKLFTLRREIDADLYKSLDESSKYLETINNNEEALKDYIYDLRYTTNFTQRFGINKERAYYFLTSYYLENEKTDECIKYTKELVDFNTNNYKNHILAGDCFMLNNEKEQAFKNYEKAWKIYPLSLELNQKLIDLHDSEGFDISPKYIRSIYDTYPRPAERLQFYFAPAGGQFDGDHYTIIDGININLSNGTYKIPLSPLANWNNSKVITSLRIDPVQLKTDGLIIGVEKIVFKRKNAKDITINDFSKWIMPPSLLRIDDNHFKVVGDDPYILLQNAFAIPSDYEDLYITLDFKIEI